LVGLLFVALGCDGASPALTDPRGPDDVGEPASGGAGASGTSLGGAGTAGSASGAGSVTPDESWTWAACGTIPSTEVAGTTQYEPGSAIIGGHPYVPGYTSRWRMTGLAMSADGRTLVSMGGVVLAWAVEADFSASRATYVDHASPEWPKLDVSPDGRWIAISGDGRRVVSRSGAPWHQLGSSFDVPEPCFPVDLRFSADGQWFAGAGWGGDIEVFRMADLETALPGALEPIATLPVSCGPLESWGGGAAMRIAFTIDGQALVTEAGGRYQAGDWHTLVPSGGPSPHGLRGGFEVSAYGAPLVSDCSHDQRTDEYECEPYAAPFPKFSPTGRWIVAGATLTHASGGTRVLDATARVGIFAPNGDVIAAGADSSLTRYCKIE
jgi:hypothetical protein